MKLDMSPEAVSRRLQCVQQLRALCLSLSASSAGRDIARRFPDNKTVKRTSQALAADRRR